MKRFQMLTHKVVRLHLHFQNGLWTLCITCSLYVTVCVITSAPIQLKNTSTVCFLFPLWRHVKQNQCPEHNLAQKSTTIDKNADLAFPVWLQCLCALYFFSSTVLPKYSFWNCWNSSSVNKDSGFSACLAGWSG